MRRLIALTAALVLVLSTGVGLMAFDDPADEARVASLETRTTCLEAGVPCPPVEATATDVPPTATDVPATATDVPPTATEPEPTATEHEHEGSVGVCGESNDAWHAGVFNGCSTGHEHGDAPPAWVINSDFPPAFTHPANTPNENALPHKHSAFKGHGFTDDGVTIYGLFHMDFNPGGHASRFHSYQIWALDAAGNVSYWTGWLDFGEGANELANIRRIHCDSTVIRPIMAVNDEGCGVVQFESWYSRAGAQAWDFGFNNKATYYLGGDPANPSTWNPTGNLNDTRRLEAAIYTSRLTQRGTFYRTQFWEAVSGPSDPLCGTTVTTGSKTYTRICLEQYVSPTMTQVSFPSNSRQAVYPMAGVSLPN